MLNFAFFIAVNFSKPANTTNEKVNLDLRANSNNLLSLLDLRAKYYRFIIFLLKTWNALVSGPGLIITFFVTMIIIIISVVGILFSDPLTQLTSEFFSSRNIDLSSHILLNLIAESAIPLLVIWSFIVIIGFLIFFPLFFNNKAKLKIPIYFSGKSNFKAKTI